ARSALHFREQRAAGERELGPEVVQVPLQRVVEPHALADQTVAMIDQQPHIELGPVKLRAWQLAEAFAQGRAGDGERVDAIGLTALARAAAGVAHELGRDPHHAFAAADQETLERAGDVSAILQRPRPLTAETPRPTQELREAASADSDGLLALQLAGARSDCGDRVRALVGVRTEHDHRLVLLFVLCEVDTRRTRLAGGAATLLSSHAGHPRPATSDTTKGSQAHGPPASKSVSSPPVGPFSSASDVTDHRIQTASLEAEARPAGTRSAGSRRARRSQVFHSRH